MLAAMDGVENELNIHIEHGKHNGLTDDEISEIISLVKASEWQPDPPKTFKTDPNIKVRKVFYKNRYNIQLTADMYLPQNIQKGVKYPAIIVGHSFGAVKEECSGLYDQELAKRGFIGLAFDASYMGQSGGVPHLTVSPDVLVEDFCASVDFLGLQDFIDKNKIGVIGICGSGGFSVSAASLDPRIKALITVSMYDIGRATRNGLKDSLSQTDRQKLFAEVADQR